ncbi:hypothetical protein Tsubulata_010036, partial [Turnera subulata]
QQSDFKHFCKICKKGFGCGRALGGHMRAHGIGDESGHMDEDEDPASDWEDKLGGNVPPSNKRMYALRTNPNRLKSCRVCENCGKEFLSWKSFLEHGKCSSEDAESLLSSPGSDYEDGMGRRGCGWSKRKRSFRAKVGNFNSTCPSSEEEDLANCLMMLSNANVDPLVAEPEESCASASKEEERRNTVNFIVPAAYKAAAAAAPHHVDKAKTVAKGLFECKACKKVFNSHQALGGHRASHKKVKGCFAARLDQGLDDSLVDDDVITHEEFFPSKQSSTMQFDQGSNTPLASPSKRKSKVHECSICHRVFSSGQALGGHKRCHWITSNTQDASSLAKFHPFQDHHMEHIQQSRPAAKLIDNSEPLDLTLDLNLPAPADDHMGLRRRDRHTNQSNNFEVTTEIYLQPWVGVGANEKDENHHHQNEDDNMMMNNNVDTTNNFCSSMQTTVDDEADSKVKLAKLSELKDINMSGGSSPWLQRHRCKLCFKTFSNGRALGGHMRSHLLNLPIPPKPEEEYPPIQLGEDTESASSASPSSSSSSSEDEGGGEGEDKGAYYGLRENPKRSIRLGDPEFSFAIDAGSVVLQDRESETESSKNPTRRRSKRTRKFLEHQYYHHQRRGQEQDNNNIIINTNINNNVIKKHSFSKLSKTTESWAEPEPVSSISDTTTEEDVAFCLMMLSRDKWKRKEQELYQYEQEEEAEAEKSIEETTDESDEFYKSCKSTTTKSARGKYKCETCNKVFKSYQALGGHRASHKKLKVSAPIQEPADTNAGTSGSVPEKKIHKCPYCNRIFSSGQALGGHKRSHVTGVAAAANTATATTSNSTKFGDNLSLIDLNLPAPVDDDDISQIELSAVSDAEFVNYSRR